jgi:hypothetical protein
MLPLLDYWSFRSSACASGYFWEYLLRHKKTPAACAHSLAAVFDCAKWPKVAEPDRRQLNQEVASP